MRNFAYMILSLTMMVSLVVFFEIPTKWLFVGYIVAVSVPALLSQFLSYLNYRKHEHAS